MLASIHPLGERARNSRFGVTAGAYLVGSTAGGLVMGAAFGAIGGWVAWPVAMVVLVCAVAASAEARGGGWPSVRRQVNEEWLTRYRGWVYGVGFGFQLGLGLVTIVTSAAVYATAGLAFLSGSAGRGAAIGSAFGVARAVPMVAVVRVKTPERLRDLHRRMQSWAAAARSGAVAGMAGLAVVAAVVR